MTKPEYFHRRMALVLSSAVALTLALPAVAQDLKIGLKTEPSSLDPQYHALTPNLQISFHIHDAVTMADKDGKLQPGLATSWKPVDDTTWEFKLRPNVKFSDGSPFTAEDVVYTYQRAAKVPNSPSPYTVYTRQIAGFEIVDPLTLRIKTDGPAPALPLDMSNLPIMPKKNAKADVAEGVTSESLNQGQGLMGTGPYKFVEWKRGTQLVLDTFELFNEAAWITRALQDALEDAKTCQWAEDGCR